MAKNEKRIKVTLECEVCKRRNYITTKNKQNDHERIEMRKYCRFGQAAHAAQRNPLGAGGGGGPPKAAAGQPPPGVPLPATEAQDGPGANVPYGPRRCGTCAPWMCASPRGQ